MLSETQNKNPPKNGHIVVLTGSTFQGSGSNMFILNNALSWKKLGYRVTIICQDRNAENLSGVDSYIKGQFPKDAPQLENGQLRVVVPDINGIIPIYATYQYCQFPGVKAKPVHQMTGEQIETNIAMTIVCLRAVCQHDRPFKVIANYMIISGTIAYRGLQDLEIPYDIITPGPALAYSVKPYPHLWKWVLPAFKKANILFQLTHFVNDQFFKCFKNQVYEYGLKQKALVINPGINPNKFPIPQSYQISQKLFLEKARQVIQKDQDKIDCNHGPIQFSTKESPQKINQILTQKFKICTKKSLQSNLCQKWLPYTDLDETVIYVGAMINNKGMGELLAIAPKLISQRPTLKFIFCGDGPYKWHMQQLLKSYEEGNFERAKRIGQAGQFITQVDIEDYFMKIDSTIRDRIIICGLASQDLLKHLLPLCTIYINPNKILQSSSTNLLEAMCFGLTPICNNHSWPKQVLDTIQTEYPELIKVIRVQKDVFFEKLPDTIIKTLDFIKNNKLQKSKYRQKIRQIVIDKYSWDSTAAILAQQRAYLQQNK